MRIAILSTSMFSLLVVGSGALAGTIFDDQFTAYTTPNYLSTAPGSLWVISDGCNDGKVSTDNPFSSPNSVTDYKNGSNQRIGIRNRYNLTAAEMLNANLVHDPNPNCVDGTDENPLVFGFKMYLGTKSSPYFYYLNVYAEVTCGDDRAPTPMITADCDGKVRPHLNLNGDGQVHKSIAIGQIAWADSDPCDTPSNQVGQTYRLTIYDGQQWKTLQTPVDMHTCANYNYVTLTIRTSTIEVKLSTMYNGSTCDGPRQELITTVARQYTGPFTAIKIGGIPDEANGGCWGQDKGSVGYSDKPTVIDDVYLADGEAFNDPNVCGVIPTGACCTGFDCAVTMEADCTGVYKGDGTTCTPKICCADPFADADFDGDVDQADFAVFQLCYTGFGGSVLPGCECFNHVPSTPPNPETVDSDDWSAFEVCASGPGIAADPSCD